MLKQRGCYKTITDSLRCIQTTLESSQDKRRRRSLETPSSFSPEMLFHQPELFGVRDCSVFSPFSIADMTELARHFSIRVSNGMYISTFQWYLEKGGISRENFLLPDSPNEALLMYEALMQLQNLH
jgi:hypothetical protein